MRNGNVFVVHGHDEQAIEEVARFLRALDYQPLILRDQPGGGRTIIESIEHNKSLVVYAVVIMTPDDVGKSKKVRRLQFRARQNVVLELGFFIGVLGRARVAALVYETIELPSDVAGLIYINLDKLGGWKNKLAQNMVDAGLYINWSILSSA